MARKKGATAVADDKPAISLDELKKKLLARGKTRGSLTYEEINLAFDALDDVSPDGSTSSSKRSRRWASRSSTSRRTRSPRPTPRRREPRPFRTAAVARRSGPHVSQGDRPRAAPFDGTREVARDAHRSRRDRNRQKQRRRRRGRSSTTATKRSASSPKPTCVSSSRSRRSTSAAACSSWTSSKKATSA